MKKDVICRFAPAPTGPLHLGSAHTALFSWLYAMNFDMKKDCQGVFKLRIEDSDKTVSTIDAGQKIVEDLQFLGILSKNVKYNDIPKQSQRQKEGRYSYYLDKLKAKGLVKEISESNSTAVMYFPSEEKIIIKDELRKKPIIVKASDKNNVLTPFIIMRGDGSPLYNFACVVDDIDMGVTHVIRGSDILVSTAKQLSLYYALDISPPKFFHLPRILDEYGSPLSKRTGAKSIEQFRREGFLKEALLNYLVLLGWSPKDGNEFLAIDEMINKFSIKDCSLSEIKFDPNKLCSVNSHYMRTLEIGELVKRFKNYLIYVNHKEKDNNNVFKFCEIYARRSRTLGELAEQLKNQTVENYNYDKELFYKYLIFPDIVRLFHEVIAIINDSEKLDNIFDNIRDLSLKLNIPYKKIAQAINFALSNSSKSPDILEMIYLLGKTESIRHLQNCIEILSGIDFECFEQLSRVNKYCEEFKIRIKQVNEDTGILKNPKYQNIKNVFSDLIEDVDKAKGNLSIELKKFIPI